ncbi:MAG: hypothetical protein LBI34_03630 [Puniceicoccales bacterium]|jgi:hypothetical protein|nr:hypothetical protein [Puniceicoccales bacterium]
MIPIAAYPLLFPLLRRITPFAGGGRSAWPVAISCAVCGFTPNRCIFIGSAFLAGIFLTIGAGLDRKYDRMTARFFALALQGLAISLLATGHFRSFAERMLFLGHIGIAGIFPFCFSRNEYIRGPDETLSYALCVLLSPFVKFSSILPALSAAIHIIGAVNEQYVWKFLHRLFAATICTLLCFGGIFHGFKWLFILLFYQILFMYLSLGINLKKIEHLTMAEVKGMAHRRPVAALELSFGVLVLSCGPLSAFFPILVTTANLFLLTKHNAIAFGICVPLCLGTAIAVRWIIQLSLYSEIECVTPKMPMNLFGRNAIRFLWVGLWVIGLCGFYRCFLDVW